MFDKIAFIGTGKMAQAVIEPLINTGVQPANQIAVFDVNYNLMKEMPERYPGIQSCNSLPELVDAADLIVCAVKPLNLTDDFFAALQAGSSNDDDNGNKERKEPILLSICAGKSIDVFRDGGFDKIVRSMPNTPAQIGQGMTVWSSTPNLTNCEREDIRKVLGSFGKAMYVDDESFIDMATSISGSGPAYIFMLMEAMIDAGVHMGFPRDKATTLVYHTMLGSTLYAMETGEHPAILRNSVTSPSGTTASAIYEFENGRFRTVIKDAMWACYRRSLEMGNFDSNVGPGRPTGRHSHDITGPQEK